jgi:hypothetical protein
MFAQETIKTDVAASWLAACKAVGEAVDVTRFVRLAVEALGGVVKLIKKPNDREALAVDLTSADPSFRAAMPEGLPDVFDAIFELPLIDQTVLLGRTHPFVEAFASHLVGTAIDDPDTAKAARSGAIRTKAVAKRTTLLLVRLRHHILRTVGADTRELLAEECQVVGFEGDPNTPAWLPAERAEELLSATPDANIAPDQARSFVAKVVEAQSALQQGLEQLANERAKSLLVIHRQLRDETRVKGLRYDVRPQVPVDVIGVYVLLPAGA